MNCLNIEIAGVNFTISCQDSITLEDFPEAYKTFLGKVNPAAGLSNMAVTLELNNIPVTKNKEKIFDTDQSWSMFFHDNEYFLSLNTPGHKKKTVWLARFGCDFKKVTVHCSKILLSELNGNKKLSNPFRYPLDQILLMYFLSNNEGALIHAAGLEFNGRGYIFPGKSGAGKSTLSRQFVNFNNFELLSDDRIVVRKFDETFKAFGTPWPGEAGIAVNKSFKLSGIFFISQAGYNRIEEIKTQKALEKLLPAVSIPWYDKEVMIRILDFCEDLISGIPAYELHFKPDNEVIDVFEKFVTK
jgi:hypothetical protein